MKRQDKPHYYFLCNFDKGNMAYSVTKVKFYNTLRKYKIPKFKWWLSLSESNNEVKHIFEFRENEKVS